MVTAVIYNVFSNERGEFGNPLAVISDPERVLADVDRIAIARALDFSEIVVIDSIRDARISIYTKNEEIAFAGHAAVGAAAHFSMELGAKIDAMHGKGGIIDVFNDGEDYFVSCLLKDTPPWWHERVESVSEIDILSGPQSPDQAHTQLWAWIDEPTGAIRSRTFAPGWDIPEDEANGSGCMRLAACLGRDITVHHGSGSILKAGLSAPGVARVGGRVTLVEHRQV